MSIEVLKTLKNQRQNNFEFYFLDSQEIRYRVLNVNLPRESFEYVKTKSGQNIVSEVVFADTVTLNILESKTFTIEKYVKEWEEIFYDKETRLFKALATENADKKTGVLIFYNPDNTIANTYIYNNLSLVGLREITLDYGTVDMLAWELEMKVEEINTI